jgi:hypothetical protein
VPFTEEKREVSISSNNLGKKVTAFSISKARVVRAMRFNAKKPQIRANTAMIVKRQQEVFFFIKLEVGI